MRKHWLFSVLVLMLTISMTQQARAVKITFGTKCHPDGNGACVGERGICLIIEIKKNNSLSRHVDPTPFLGDDMAYGEMTLISNNEVRLQVLAQNSDVRMGEEFILEEPIVLNAEVSGDLGYAKMVLLPGVYRVDYSLIPLGTVNIPVAIR